jgi:hypothetical protein
MICAELLLEAMAIYNDIFIEDIVELRQDKEKVFAHNLPYKINIKEHALELPTFTQPCTQPQGFVPHVVNESVIPVASSSSAAAPLEPTLTLLQMAKIDKQTNNKSLTLQKSKPSIILHQ